MIVVSDTSPIRALAHLGRLDLLPLLFGQVLIPPAVDAELRIPRRLLPAVDVSKTPTIQIRAPIDQNKVRQLLQELGPGEAEAIVLALELGAGNLLIDERAGRQKAISLGLRPMGVLGVLTRAKAAGHISAIKPLLDRLQTEINFFVSPEVRTEILQDAGEAP